MGFWVNKIELKSGTSITLGQGLTVLVGPNNAGKSVLLREVFQHMHGGISQGKIVQDVHIEHAPSKEEFVDSVASRLALIPPGQYSYGHFNEPHFRSPQGNTATRSQIEAAWGTRNNRSLLTGLLARHLDAEGRTNQVLSQGAFDLYREAPSGALQLMYADRAIEDLASTYMNRAFGTPMTINRYRGGTISAHVGRPDAAEAGPPPDAEYLSQLSALPELQEQGDGFKAFMGILFSVAFGGLKYVSIDEPEAFLHPPQAYLLGQILAELNGTGTQVIVATHSVDLLKGITSTAAGAGRVSVVRLTRKSTVNRAAVVEPEAIHALHSDPLVRHFPIMDGFFYHGTVLCEGDSDVTYFRAVIEDLADKGDEFVTAALNLHLAHCNGKARIHTALSMLRSAGVPSSCIVDLDLLRVERDFDLLVKAAGGDPSTLHGLRNVVVDAITVRNQAIDKDVAKIKIERVFANRPGGTLTRGDIQKIRDAIDAPTGWNLAKQSGRSGFSGGVIRAFDELDLALKGIGVFLVTEGVLERYHPEVPQGDKAAWLREVLVSEKYRSTLAAGLIRDVAAYTRAQQ